MATLFKNTHAVKINLYIFVVMNQKAECFGKLIEIEIASQINLRGEPLRFRFTVWHRSAKASSSSLPFCVAEIRSKPVSRRFVVGVTPHHGFITPDRHQP